MFVLLCLKCDSEWPRDEELSKKAKCPIPAKKCDCGADKSFKKKIDIGVYKRKGE